MGGLAGRLLLQQVRHAPIQLRSWIKKTPNHSLGPLSYVLVVVVLALHRVPWIQSLPIVFDFDIFHLQGLVPKMLYLSCIAGAGLLTSLLPVHSSSRWLKKKNLQKEKSALICFPNHCVTLC